MAAPDTVSWNSIIAGYARCGEEQKALDLFRQMRREGFHPNSVTFVAAIKACSNLGSSDLSRNIHEQACSSGLESDIYVGSCLIDMYSKCGDIESACDVFDNLRTADVAVWNSMIVGFVRCEQWSKALELFKQMEERGADPDHITYVALLNACAGLAELDYGRRIHTMALRKGLTFDIFIQSSLVDMYAKCGRIEDASAIFDNMRVRDVVAWGAMIMGHVRNNESEKALWIYRQMQQELIEPNAITFVTVLNACSNLAALEEGMLVHSQIIQTNLESDTSIGNSLIDMYAKCGNVDDAFRIFTHMPTRSTVSCNAMLSGCAVNGLGKEALRIFEQMCTTHLKTDESTFVSLLLALRHSGLVDEGCLYFEFMTAMHGILPRVDHFSCMVGLLGHSSHLDEAEAIVKNMWCEPDVFVWTALLSACRIHSDVARGEFSARQILKLDPNNESAYVLLSNIYTSAGESKNSAFLHEMRKGRLMHKQPGRTWIKLNNQIHTFVVDDKDHPQIIEIKAKLQSMFEEIAGLGRSQIFDACSHGVNEAIREHASRYHSEMLAIAFGLMSTHPSSPLRLLKNLRVCNDCHTSTKFISKITGRSLVVRDSSRFHHFKDGVCSCMDFW